MKKRGILENAIIKDGVVHMLVEAEGENSSDCSCCSLKEVCGNDVLCRTFGEDIDGKKFVEVGTIDKVLAKEEARKQARHQIAVLMQYKRWMRSDARIESIRSPSLSDRTDAIDFAIQELKKIY